MTTFAAILPGWSANQKGDAPGFVFNGHAHQPGSRLLTGRVFPEGEAGGILALDMPATHPTIWPPPGHHLAGKLATHVVSDTPHPRTVALLSSVLVRTGGDLGAVGATLVALPEALGAANQVPHPARSGGRRGAPARPRDRGGLPGLVLVPTEFGRISRANGTGGTGHGTATVAFLPGGSVSGGRVGGVWPGLSQRALFENRDPASTTDMRSLAKGVLRAHPGLDGPRLERVFPNSGNPSPPGRLIRA